MSTPEDRQGPQAPTLPASSQEGLGTAAVRHAAARKLFGATTDAVQAPHLHRYAILERVGAGGMGQVFAAYDPELDRKVAIKVLHRQFAETQGRAGLVEEAKAMARLDHPNVVSVYDVGEVDEQVFVAMEFVAGGTLTKWLRESKAEPREILALLGQAGRGLAAAHAAGLVHRDFKPDNVLISMTEEGRPRARVSDFGLAQLLEGDGDPTATDDEHPEPDRRSTLRIAGTPAYMAPEQHEGTEIGPAADQFAFCVVVCEALTGERPFAGADYPELRAAVLEGTPDPAVLDRLPRHVRAVVRRGLHVRPEDRWPDLQTLLRELRRDPGARLRRTFFGVGLLGTSAAAVWGWQREAEPVCEVDVGRLGDAWSAQRQSEVETAVLGTGVAYADAVWEQISGSIDGWADDWVQQRREACLATRVRGEQSETLLDRRMSCLDRKQVELEALTRVLTQIEPDEIQAVSSLGSSLPNLQACGAQLDQDLPPPPEADRTKVEMVQADLAMVEALKVAGRYPTGLELARKAVQDARALKYRPLLAEALMHLGRLQQRSGDAATAETTLEEALFESEAIGHDEVTLWAALELTWTVGNELSRMEDGLKWGRMARAKLERLDRLGTDAENQLRLNLGSIYSHHRKLSEAQRELQTSLELAQRLHGEDSPRIASDLHNLGQLEKDLGNYDAAQTYLERSRELLLQAYGPDHPDLVTLDTTLGLVFHRRGEYEDAERMYQRALDLAERTLGPDHPRVVTALNNLANAAERMGQLERAAGYHRKTLEIVERTQGPRDMRAGVIRVNMANVLQLSGEYEAAIAEYRLGYDILLEALGPDNGSLAYALVGEGRALSELGRRKEARDRLERAWMLTRDDEAADPTMQGRIGRLLAPLLWDDGQRAEALELARWAQEAYARSQNAAEEDKQALQAWLAEHGGDQSEAG